MTEATIDLAPLIEGVDMALEEGPRVVAIGGGHGLAQALQAIVEYAGTVTAVVSVADDGGSSGRLSPALDIPPPGDIRRALLALSPEPSLWRDVVAYRFREGDVAGHSLGNLLIAALTELDGGFTEALGRLGGALGARGRVVPAAQAPLVLEADIDGGVVRGQVAIARSRGAIDGLRVDPADTPASPEALAAIADADQIVLGPGSLFTSVGAVLVVAGMADAINAASATLVYVANLTTQDGETLGMPGPAHLEALEMVCGVRRPDAVVLHDGHLETPPGLEPVAFEEVDGGPRVVRGDVAVSGDGRPRHDPARLGAVLRRLV